jgi:hypothetical protein
MIGIWAINISLLLGMVASGSMLIIAMIRDPRLMAIEEVEIVLIFWLRPNKFVYFFEVKDVYISQNRRVLAMRMMENNHVYSLTPEAVRIY